MKKILIALILMSKTCYGQTLIGVHLSGYKNLYVGDRLFYGAGLNVKHFVSEKVALGLGIKFLTHKDIGKGLSNESILPTTALAEYHFVSQYDLTPYIGVETGLVMYHNRWENRLGLSNNFVFSPKFGLTYPISYKVTAFAEAQYNLFIYNNFEQTYRTSATFYDGLMFNIGVHFNSIILTDH